jgi:predicted transcriptional regulator
VNPISLPKPLLAKLQDVAQTQGRTADEIAAAAVSKYLKAQKWTKIVERNHERARESGTADTNIFISALNYPGGKLVVH